MLLTWPPAGQTMWATPPLWGLAPALRRTSRMGSAYSPFSVKAPGSAASQMRIQPREVPVQRSPQGVRHRDVMDPTLCACNAQEGSFGDCIAFLHGHYGSCLTCTLC